MAHAIELKRVYEPADKSDGARILVDRLWPRGVKKEEAALDAWLKDLSPSTGLREWFGHDPAKWAGFGQRYRAELRHNPALAELRERARRGDVTLVYSARDMQHNQAVVLKQVLDRGS